MEERARLLRAWEELPKTPHGRQIEDRHPDVRPEWIMYVVESPNAYEWTEYSSTDEENLRVWTIRVAWVSEIARWVEVVIEEFSDGGQFDTAYRLRDKQVEQRLKGKTRRN